MSVAERTEPAKITILQAGSPIPDWLLAADPQHPGAPKGNWRMRLPASVIELQDDFIVFPILEPGTLSSMTTFDFDGMAHHHLYAASKPVRVVVTWESYYQIEYTQAVETKQRELQLQALAENARLREAVIWRTESAEQVSPRLRFGPLGIYGLLGALFGTLGFGVGVAVLSLAAHFFK